MGRRVCGVKESVKEGEGQKEEDFEEIRAEVNEGLVRGSQVGG